MKYEMSFCGKICIILFALCLFGFGLLAQAHLQDDDASNIKVETTYVDYYK